MNKNTMATAVSLLVALSSLSVSNGFHILDNEAVIRQPITPLQPPRQSPRLVSTTTKRSSHLFMSVGGGANNDAQTVEDVVATKKSTQLSASMVEAMDMPGSTTTSDTNNNGLVGTAQKFLDDTTGGWALSYVDLSPETERSPVGMTFLATNVGYAICGVLLSMKGEVLLGTLTEMASIASFGYHYNQLKFGTDATAPEVRLALLVDYVVAITSMSVATGYLVLNGELPPLEVTAAAVAALACLFASWIWTEGIQYIFWHSLWHLFGAYTGFVVGNLHLTH